MNEAATRPGTWTAAAVAAVIALASAATDAVAGAPAADPAIAKSPDDPSLAWGPCPDFLPAGCAIAVLHGDPARPNVDIFFRVPPRAEIPSHTHTSAERMVLVTGEMQVTYAGQPAVNLTPGSYAYGPAGHPHHATCVSDGPCTLFIAFEAPLDAIPSDGDDN
jgi:quercetin dioxygenase-like cupin family protein